jgi:hypothetical protein
MRKGAFVLLAVIAVGCGGERPSSSPVTPAAGSASPSPSVAAAPWPSGDPVPPELTGVWFRGETRMRLSGNTFDIGFQSGNVVVRGSEILFFNDAGCRPAPGKAALVLPDGIGRYSWRVTDSSVHFVLLAVDPCTVLGDVREALLSGQTWTRTRT